MSGTSPPIRRQIQRSSKRQSRQLLGALPQPIVNRIVSALDGRFWLLMRFIGGIKEKNLLHVATNLS